MARGTHLVSFGSVCVFDSKIEETVCALTAQTSVHHAQQIHAHKQTCPAIHVTDHPFKVKHNKDDTITRLEQMS